MAPLLGQSTAWLSEQMLPITTGKESRPAVTTIVKPQARLLVPAFETQLTASWDEAATTPMACIHPVNQSYCLNRCLSPSESMQLATQPTEANAPSCCQLLVAALSSVTFCVGKVTNVVDSQTDLSLLPTSVRMPIPVFIEVCVGGGVGVGGSLVGLGWWREGEDKALAPHSLLVALSMP